MGSKPSTAIGGQPKMPVFDPSKVKLNSRSGRVKINPTTSSQSASTNSSAAGGFTRPMKPSELKAKQAKTTTTPNFMQRKYSSNLKNCPNFFLLLLFNFLFIIIGASAAGKKKKPTDILMDWVKETVQGYDQVEVRNFTTSWRNGMALCALIHRYRPHMIDFKSLNPDEHLTNLEMALSAGEKCGIPRLLDPEDIDIRIPERLSMITYISEVRKGLLR